MLSTRVAERQSTCVLFLEKKNEVRKARAFILCVWISWEHSILVFRKVLFYVCLTAILCSKLKCYSCGLNPQDLLKLLKYFENVKLPQKLIFQCLLNICLCLNLLASLNSSNKFNTSTTLFNFYLFTHLNNLFKI